MMDSSYENYKIAVCPMQSRIYNKVSLSRSLEVFTQANVISAYDVFP